MKHKEFYNICSLIFLFDIFAVTFVIIMGITADGYAMLIFFMSFLTIFPIIAIYTEIR